MIPKSFVETFDRRDVRIDSTGAFPDRNWALSWNSERLLAVVNVFDSGVRVQGSTS